MEEFLKEACAIEAEAAMKIALLTALHRDPSTLEQLLKPVYNEMAVKLTAIGNQATQDFKAYREQFEVLLNLMKSSIKELQAAERRRTITN